MIRVLCDKSEPGAVHQPRWDSDGPDGQPIQHFTREYAIGYVVEESEVNGYDDSDFWCTYFDVERCEFISTQWGTTRGWCYPNACVVDAPPCVMDLWRAYQSGLAASKARARLKELAEELKPCCADKIAETYARRLLELGENYARPIIALLASQPRSEFKQSLRKQVLHWLAQDKPPYPVPLSHRQYACLISRGKRHFAYR